MLHALGRDESSHMPHIERPEAFLERVEAVLRTID
jgi:hypothetical protein